MRQMIHPGKTIDIPSTDEIRALLAQELRALRSDQRTWRDEGSTKTDANGAALVTAATVPVGMEFALHRLVIEADGFTPGAPFQAAAAFVAIMRNDHREDFFTLAAPAGIPAVFTAGEADAIRYSNGEKVQLQIVAGPASTGVVCRVQGTLQPVTVT